MLFLIVINIQGDDLELAELAKSEQCQLQDDLESLEDQVREQSIIYMNVKTSTGIEYAP